jgi:hypothetical protein
VRESGGPFVRYVEGALEGDAGTSQSAFVEEPPDQRDAVRDARGLR